MLQKMLQSRLANNKYKNKDQENDNSDVKNYLGWCRTAQKNAQFLINQARISNEFLELARKERKAGNRTLLDVLEEKQLL